MTGRQWLISQARKYVSEGLDADAALLKAFRYGKYFNEHYVKWHGAEYYLKVRDNPAAMSTLRKAVLRKETKL